MQRVRSGGCLPISGFWRRRLDVRRTASWSTSDAFTDGHIVEGSEMMMPGLRTKAATSRAHGFRRYHQGTMGRSSSDAQSRSFDVSLHSAFSRHGIAMPVSQLTILWQIENSIMTRWLWCWSSLPWAVTGLSMSPRHYRLLS